MEDKRFAILIDADNISAKYISYILDEISNYGVATYKRIYGDWTRNSSAAWKDVLLENSITPIQQYSYTSGKNATDSAMIIDAMDILYSKNVDGFCIASSDSDFTKLSSRLRESAMFVVGMGERKTPKPFIASCNQFKYLDVLVEVEKKTIEEDQHHQVEANKAPVVPTSTHTSSVKQGTPNNRKPVDGQGQTTGLVVENVLGQNQQSENKPVENQQNGSTSPLAKVDPTVEAEKSMTELSVIRAAVLKMLNENDETEQYMNMGEIGSRLMKRYPDFDVRNYGDTKLSKFLKKFDFIEIHTQGNSSSLWVCLKKETDPDKAVQKQPAKKNKTNQARRRKQQQAVKKTQ